MRESEIMQPQGMSPYPDISAFAGYRERTVPSYSKTSLTQDFANILMYHAEQQDIALCSYNPHELSRFLFTRADEDYIEWNTLQRDCYHADQSQQYPPSTQAHYLGRKDVLASAEMSEYYHLKHDRLTKHLLYYKQDRQCVGCDIIIPIGQMTIDHILAKAKGGPNVPSNLQLMCKPCNEAKADR